MNKKTEICFPKCGTYNLTTKLPLGCQPPSTGVIVLHEATQGPFNIKDCDFFFKENEDQALEFFERISESLSNTVVDN